MLIQPAHADDVEEGLEALKQGDYKTAFKKCKPIAEKGNSTAQFNLGLMYDRVDGVRQNFSKAVKWYKLEAKHKNVKLRETLSNTSFFGIYFAFRANSRKGFLISNEKPTQSINTQN